ncbi:hypothetical protein QBC32DRAFT_397809 [Pseudoneurospora amorphoporcata]|uniref:RRM domain-containing protein n=1 Tax=Pseudoneurospora amorphoporcata TaxID=241081 RepID=A0AAN6NZ45_9PEZI|nr:hypothetical protein QBC32DRAFT_397809 [Pseudoneurospora amorphoporcata]
MVGIPYAAKGYRQIGDHRPFSTVEVVLLISLASFTTSLIVFSIVYSVQHRGPIRPALAVSISGSIIFLLVICYIVYSRIRQARQFHDLENREDGQSSPSSYTINTYSPSVETISPNMRFAPTKDFRKNRNGPFWASSTTILPANAADDERLLDHSSEQYTTEKEKERKPGTSRSRNLEKANNINIVITEPEPVASRHGISLEFDPLRSHPVDLDRGTSIKQPGTPRNLTAIPRSAESDKDASNRNHSAVDSGPGRAGPRSASTSHRHHHLRKSKRPTIGNASARQDLRASIRRAALRQALSASRAITAQAPAASFSASVARAALVSSRIQAIRFFSQSPRVLNTEETFQPEQTETETAPAATEEDAVQKDARTGHTAFVRNIVFDATEEHLKGAFEKFGDVTDVFLAKDARGLSKGFGFVTFATKEALEEACSQVDGSFWHGRRISTTDAELNNIFVGIDGLKDVRVAVDRATGWPRGFAHADFVDVEHAVKALEKLQGVQLGERAVKLDYAQPAVPRQPRENNGERREYNREGGNRSYGNRDGGSRSYGNRDGGNRSYGNRDGGNRSYGNREGGQRSYNREGGNRN